MGRGYGVAKCELASSELERLRADLTIDLDEDVVGAGSKYVVVPSDKRRLAHLYLESSKKIYVPWMFGVKRFGPPQQAPSNVPPSTAAIPDDRAQFTAGMRDHQTRAVDAFLAAGRTGILSIPCGGGKTVVALKLVSMLATRTLIVVHKDFLIAQWKERIAEFLPKATVGTIKAAKVDVVGKDVVIASLQSLSMKTYPKELYAELDTFGFLIVDEVHRTGTEVFSRALKRISMRSMLGLSATVERKDGMDRIFKWYLGDVVFEIERKDIEAPSTISRTATANATVQVNLIRFRDPSDPGYAVEEYIGSSGKLNHSKMINNVCANAKRLRVSAGLLRAALDRGRRCLVLSDRKSMLRELSAELLASHGTPSAFYVGGMKPAELKASEGCDVILATFAFASEGFDVQGLDTLFLLSPKSDVRQAVGRVLRQEASARLNQPVVYDMVDGFSVFLGQARKRTAYYKSQGFKLAWISSDFAAADGGGGGREEEEEEEEEDEEHDDDDGCCCCDGDGSSPGGVALFVDDD